MERKSLNRHPRYAKIKQKLAFAHTQFLGLQAILHARSTGKIDSAFVEELIEVILSACRECLDYCARDVSEQLLATPVKEPKFPFTKQSLATHKLGDAVSRELPALHQYLAQLIDAIDRDAGITDTMLSMGVLRLLNELVNDKKHNVTVAIRDREDAATMIVHGGTAVVMRVFENIQGSRPDATLEYPAPEMGPPRAGSVIRSVSEVRILFNGWEAGRFCGDAIGVTWRVLDEIYFTFFGEPQGNLDPSETIKPREQREFEAAYRRLSPIVHRLLVVALRKGGANLAVIEYAPDGRALATSKEDADLALDFLQVFEQGLHSEFHQALQPVLCERLVHVERQGANPRIMEFEVELPEPRSVQIAGEPIEYSSVIFGVNTTFRDTDHKTQQRKRRFETTELLKRLLAVERQWTTFVGTRPLGRSRDRPKD